MLPPWGISPSIAMVVPMSPDPYSHTSPEAFDPREQAERCRRLARTVTDQRALDALHQMASAAWETTLPERRDAWPIDARPALRKVDLDQGRIEMRHQIILIGSTLALAGAAPVAAQPRDQSCSTSAFYLNGARLQVRAAPSTNAHLLRARAHQGSPVAEIIGQRGAGSGCQ
jgi:hypothetical protein